MTIEIKDLSKNFGSTKALVNVSLSFEENSIYGLLGNNGAGKSTLFNIITNRLYPTSGTILLDGKQVADNDHALGNIFMQGDKNLYPEDMRVKKALEATAHFYPDFDMKYALTLAEKFELPLKKKIQSLSTGYASIFRLVLALSVNTPYLLLDEPVLGLDAQHRDMFYKTLLQKYAENPCCVVISTHLIAEVAGIISQAVILRQGQVIRNLPVEEMLASGYSVSGPAKLVDDYSIGRNIISSQSLGGLKTVCLEGERDSAAPMGLEFDNLNLQDYFIQLMTGEGKNHE